MWSTTGNMVNRRSWHRDILWPAGQALVAGGGGDFYGSIGTELYDPASGTWSTTGRVAFERDWHTASLLHGGQVLVSGGVGYPGNEELYDPVSGRWSATGRLVNSRALHTATLPPNGQVLVAGDGVMAAFSTAPELTTSPPSAVSVTTHSDTAPLTPWLALAAVAWQVPWCSRHGVAG
jgi:hypothetical protein